MWRTMCMLLQAWMVGISILSWTQGICMLYRKWQRTTHYSVIPRKRFKNTSNITMAIVRQIRTAKWMSIPGPSITVPICPQRWNLRCYSCNRSDIKLFNTIASREFHSIALRASFKLLDTITGREFHSIALCASLINVKTHFFDVLMPSSPMMMYSIHLS